MNQVYLDNQYLMEAWKNSYTDNINNFEDLNKLPLILQKEESPPTGVSNIPINLSYWIKNTMFPDLLDTLGNDSLTNVGDNIYANEFVSSKESYAYTFADEKVDTTQFLFTYSIIQKKFVNIL